MDTLPNDANVMHNLNEELKAVQAERDRAIKENKRLRAELDAVLRIPSEVLMDDLLNHPVDRYTGVYERVHKRIAEKLTIAAGAKRRRVESTDSGSD